MVLEMNQTQAQALALTTEVALGYECEPLTGFELFAALGVEDPESQSRSVLVNACINAAYNPRVQKLPRAEALRVVANAANMIDQLI